MKKTWNNSNTLPATVERLRALHLRLIRLQAKARIERAVALVKTHSLKIENKHDQ